MDRVLVEELLEQEESQVFECKRANARPSSLLETIVAFANSEGGILVIGLEDPKKAKGHDRIYGVSENPDNVSEFLKLIEKDVHPVLRFWSQRVVQTVNRSGVNDDILMIQVQKSDDIHSLRHGDTYVRRGQQRVKIGSSEITRLRYERGAQKYEDELSQVSDIKSLDQSLLEAYKKANGSQQEDTWRFLNANGLAVRKNGKNYLTNAGVLLFANNPSVQLRSKVGLKISHYFGTSVSFSGEPNFVVKPFTIEGPLLVQIQEAIEYFRRIVKSAKPRLRGATFQSALIVPEWVFQEAVTNAVIHRNYVIQDDIHIRFFDDRVEIESPGSYAGHVTVSNIRHERFARNPMILRTLNRFQSPPNLDVGEGVDRMFQVMKEYNLYDPIFYPPEKRGYSVLVVLLNLQRIEYWDTVSQFLDSHYRIKNQDARKITGIKDTLEMSRLLNSWVSKGLLEKRGEKRGAYYEKRGQNFTQSLFSMGDDNNQ